jgi:hypothetical protein
MKTKGNGLQTLIIAGTRGITFLGWQYPSTFSNFGDDRDATVQTRGR